MPAQLARCPTCQATLQLPPTTAAIRLRCPHCGSIFPVSASPPTVSGSVTVDAVPEQATVDHVPPAPVPGTVPSLPGGTTVDYQDPADAQTVEQHRSQSTLNRGADGTKEPPKVQLPGYEIFEELGRGGMGVVYRARQQSLKRPVALKMILAGLSAGDEQLLRFRTEAEAVAHLQHPHIVQIYEIGEHEGRPYFSLEYVDGGSLAQRLKQGPLEPRQAAHLAEVLARAIQHAHQRGVIHRDLKPANILLMEDGTPKITDFGLAKRLEGDMGQTRSGSILGTPSYMSPEQAQGGAAHVGPLADVYALGAILYELLTGRPPFRGDSLMATLHQVVHDEVVPPSRLYPRLDRDLETICLKALAREPGQRYASALALAQDLERYQAGEPILARRAGLLRLGLRRLRRNAVAVGAGAVIVLAAALAGYFFLGASTTRQTSSLTTQITTALDHGDWSPEALAGIEQLVARLETLDPRRAAVERQRLHERFGQGLEERLHAARLEAADIPPIESGIAWLESRDATRAGQLRQALQERLRQWQELFDLRAPFAKIAEVFPPETVEVRKDRLHVPGPSVLTTTTPSRGAVLLEAEFDPSWQETNAVGLLLGCEETHAGEVRQVVFSPDGKRLYSAGNDRTTRVWDVATGRPLLTLRDHTEAVNSVALSPDGKVLATGSNDGAIVVRHADTGARITSLRHPGVLCLAFSPDGKRLLAGGWEKSVAAWDTGRWQRLGGVEKLLDTVVHVGPAAEKNQLVAVTYHGTVCVCDLAAGKILHTRRPPKELEADTWALALDPRRFLLKQAGKVSLEDPEQGRERRVLAIAREDAQRGAVSADGRMLAVTNAARLRLVNLEEGRITAEMAVAGSGYISALGFTPRGNLVAVGLESGIVALYDTATGSLRQRIGIPGYAFVLAAEPQARAAPEGNRPQEGPRTFAQRRKAGARFEARILRNGQPLRRVAVDAPAGPLHLRARRDHDRLELQVNGGQNLVFHDLLPLPGTARSVLGILCPPPASLTHLSARAETMSSRPSPLEQGDELFEKGSYVAALKQYQGQMVAARGAELRQEAQCRAGMCLVHLERLDEAVEMLGPVAGSSGERWPAIAACQLWLIRLRQNRLDDLEDLLTSMTTRFSREQLVAYVPDDVREQALALAGFSARDAVLFEPQLLRKGQIGVALADLFQEDRMRLWGRYGLARMYCMAGQEDRGLAVLHELLQLPHAQPGSSEPSAVVFPLRSITWLMRRHGQAEAALKLLDRYLFDESGAVRALPAPAGAPESAADRGWRSTLYLPLYLERSRLHAALGQWDRAEEDIDTLIRLTPADLLPYNHHAACYFLKGFLCQRRGDAAGAQKAWKTGIYPAFLARLPAERRRSCPSLPIGEGLIQHLAMAALTGSVSDEAAQAIFQQVQQSLGGGSTMASKIAGLVNIRPVLLRDMWLSSRGREVARQMAFYDLPPREYFRCPLYLCAFEKARQEVLSRPAGADEEQQVWQLLHRVGEAVLDRRLSQTQLLQFGLSYKGTTGFLGWGGLAPTLEPGLRAQAAYFLGLRFLRLNRPQDALRFFQTAVKDAGTNATLRRLAQTALDHLRKS